MCNDLGPIDYGTTNMFVKQTIKRARNAQSKGLMPYQQVILVLADRVSALETSNNTKATYAAVNAAYVLSGALSFHHPHAYGCECDVCTDVRGASEALALLDCPGRCTECGYPDLACKALGKHQRKCCPDCKHPAHALTGLSDSANDR